MRSIIFVLLVVFLGVTTSCAADAPKVAGSVSAKEQIKAKTIFDYQKEVGLSDKQVADMKKVMEDLKKTVTKNVEELATARKSLEEMLKDKKDLAAIKRQLQKVANIQVENTYLDLESSRKIESILTPAQIAAWKNIQMKVLEEVIAERKAQQAAASEKAPVKK